MAEDNNIADKQQSNSIIGVPFVKGDPRINRAGRPKGMTLKERLKEKLSAMNDEEMDDFLKGIAALDKWKMAEGNPATDTNIGNKDGKPFIIRIEPEIAEQNGIDESTINDSEGQEPV
jgi:hypothetical protein